MKTYEQPLIFANDELCEGVYAASGDSTGTTKCDSIHRKGVYKALVSHNDADANHTSAERGCEGCPVNWNDGICHVSTVNYEGDFRPSWEKAGKGPTDQW